MSKEITVKFYKLEWEHHDPTYCDERTAKMLGLDKDVDEKIKIDIKINEGVENE